MIQNIATIYTDLEEVKKDLQELFETRRFLLIYSEVVIHYNRLRVSTETLKSDMYNSETCSFLESSIDFG